MAQNKVCHDVTRKMLLMSTSGIAVRLIGPDDTFSVLYSKVAKKKTKQKQQKKHCAPHTKVSLVTGLTWFSVCADDSKDLRGNLKPTVSAGQTGLKPVRDQETLLKIFSGHIGSGIKISLQSGSYFLPGYQIFLSKNFG